MAIIIVIFACVWTLRAAYEAAQQPALKPFDLASDPSFRNYRQVVEAFAHRHRPKAESDFCVVGYLTNDSRKSAWVIWRQGKKIILWEGQDDLDASNRKLDLKSDVVAAQKDLHGSTYRVTRAWVQDLNATCERSGVEVRISKDDARKE